MADREFLLKIVGDVSDAQKSLGKLETDVSSFKSGAAKVGAAVGGALAIGGVVAFGKGMVDVASSTEQALGASQSVFGDFAAEMEAFSDNSAKNLGLAKADFLEVSTVTGAMLKNMGIPMGEVTTLTQDLTERAADMAAMYGGTVAEAMDAINSGLKGQADPLEKYAVGLTAAKVQAEALALGLLDAEGNMSAAAKAQATTSLIMKESADTAGTFADEADTLAGSTAIAKAQFSDLQGELGGKLMPTIVSLMGVILPLIDILVANADLILPIVGAIAAVVLAIKAWNTIQIIWNAIMALNPIVAFALAIGALVALLVVAYMKVDWFKDAVDGAFGFLKGVFEGFIGVLGWVKDNIATIVKVMFLPWYIAFEAVKLAIQIIPDAFRGMIDAVRWVVGQVTGAITYPFELASNTIGGIADALKAPWQSLVDWFRTGFAKVKDLIEAPIKSAIDGFKWLWNHSIGGFGFTIPAWIPLVGGKEFRIPMLAAGGIAMSPMLALIGENGPEAVVPLDRGFGGVTINVYALTANAEVGRVVKDALLEYERTSGMVA